MNERLGLRRLPALTLVVFGVTLAVNLTQLLVHGMLARIERAPSGLHGDWWRTATALFGQDGGVPGTVSNLIFLVAVGVLAEDPYAARLLTEQVLFGADEVIEDFVERFARRNLEVVRELLESGREAGILRDVEPMFLLPSLLGGCLYFFLAAPLMHRLFGIEEISPELAERFADHAAEVALHGIAARAESAT